MANERVTSAMSLTKLINFTFHPFRMRHPFAFFALSASLMGLLCLTAPAPHVAERRLPPQPIGTEVRYTGEEAEEFEKRRQWVERMHRCASGTDWRAIDRQTRLHRYRRGNAMHKVNVLDTFANGNLIGEWRERGSRNQAGRMHLAWMDTTAQKIYAGSSGGNIWRGNPDGSNWTSLNDPMQFDEISLIRQIPHNGGTRLLVGTTGKQFWYSDDEGATWQGSTGLTSIEGWGWIPRTIVADDSRHTIYLLAVEWDYTNWNAMTSIYRSLDHGASFDFIISWGEPDEGNSGYFDIWTPLLGDSTAYMLHSGDVFTLNYATGMPDSIGTFVPNSDGRTLLTGQVIAGNTHLYAFVDQDIYHSPDGGTTWNFKADIARNPFFRTSFNASLTVPGLLWFGDVDCRRSADSGATWTAVNSWTAYYGNPASRLHADIPSIVPFIDAGGAEKQFIGTDGGLYISTNGLASVSNLSLNGLNVGQYYSSYTHRSDPGYLYVGSQDQGFQRGQTDPGGILSFTQVISGDYGHLISANNGTSIWMVYPGFADYYGYAPTGNSMGNWDFINVPLWLPPLLADTADQSVCYLAGGYLTTSGSHIIKLDHNGNTVTASEMPYDFEAAAGGILTAMEWSPVNHRHWYGLTENGKFFHSSDGGVTFTLMPGPDGPESHYFYGSDILASRFTLGRVYIAGSGYDNPGFMVSDDHGATFTDATNGLPTTLIYGITANADESLIFAATEVGPYVYDVSLGQWFEMTGAPDQAFWAVDYIPVTNTVRFCTYGRGIWDFAITYPVVTTVPDPQQQFAVRAFPNPASDEVIIAVARPASELVSLTWRDANGKELRRSSHRIHETQGTLRQDVRSFPAGIYFCEVSEGDWREVKKIIVNH